MVLAGKRSTMADKLEDIDESAEKAYAEAAAKAEISASAKPVVAEPKPAPKSKLPAKRKPAAKSANKPKAAAKRKPATKPKVAAKVETPAAAKTPEPAPSVAKAPAEAKFDAPVEAVEPTPIPAAEKVEEVAKAPAPNPVKLKTKEVKPKPKPRPAKAPVVKASTTTPKVTDVKELTMAAAKNPDYSAMMSDLQTRAKDAYEKGTAAMGEVTEFSKGNVEAVVESGKIMAGGVQAIGKSCVEDAKSAYEIMTADFKEMAAIKSPTELFQLQGKIMRRNLDTFIASGSKSTEAMIKLANDAFAPISSRVNMAAEKMSKAA